MPDVPLMIQDITPVLRQVIVPGRMKKKKRENKINPAKVVRGLKKNA